MIRCIVADNALANWQDIREQIAGAGKILILLDLDGTLAPIVDKPEDVELVPSVLGTLRHLAGLPSVTVGIISGRGLDDLECLLSSLKECLFLAGNHGLEIKWNGKIYRYPVDEEMKGIMNRINMSLKENMDVFKGAIIEDKGLTLSVHYRCVPASLVDDLKAVFEEQTEAAAKEGIIRVTKGKKVLEVRPAVEWDKAKACRWITEMTKNQDAIAVYIGDDETDECVFSDIADSGVAIVVDKAAAASNARYSLFDPAEVNIFLSYLLDEMRHG